MESDLLYLLLVCAAWGCALAVFALALKRRGLSVPVAFIGMAAGVPLALIAGKLLWLAFNSQQFDDYGAACLVRFLPGEFSFTGACAGLVLAVVLAALLRKERPARVLDAFAPALCVFTVIARLAELFVGDLGLAETSYIGLPEITDGSLIAFFPFAVRDSWGFWQLGASGLEAVAALVFTVPASVVLRRELPPRLADKNGVVFEAAAFGLCASAFFPELYKITALVFYYIRVEQLLCAVVMLALVIRVCRVLSRRKLPRPYLPLILFLVFLALNAFTQYFLDKYWQFANLFPESVFDWICNNLRPTCAALILATTVCMVLVYVFPFRKAYGLNRK